MKRRTDAIQLTIPKRARMTAGARNGLKRLDTSNLPKRPKQLKLRGKEQRDIRRCSTVIAMMKIRITRIYMVKTSLNT